MTNSGDFILTTHAMLTTASSPETATIPSSQLSTAISRKDTPRITITFMLLRIYRLLRYAASKNRLSKNPTKAPSAIPNRMETGMFTKSIQFTVPVPFCAIPAKVVNSTITKISSQEAPAMIICGMLLLVPMPFSIIETMRGTTTAGDTAASTAPITAPSSGLSPKSSGANKKYPRISKLAGTQDIMTAGRPTFFRSARLSDSPALSRMMMSAICLKSAEMERMDGSSRLSTYGPNRIPVNSIPMMRGRCSLWQIPARASPTRKISARDVNIKNSSLKQGAKKADVFCDQKITEVISSKIKRFWTLSGCVQGRTSFPKVF